MASEMRPLRTVMREVLALVAQKATGALLIVTEDNRFASIRLRAGKIDEVSFKNRYNDEGVELLSQVHTLRARFQPGLAPPTKHLPIGEAAMRWLLGGFENQQPATVSAPSHSTTSHPTTAHSTTASGAGGTDQRALRREIIEHVALSYLGPIAGLLCEEAFADGKGVDQALRQVASNLTEPGEADRFVAEVYESINKAT
jgi:hypothetical protein